MNRKPWHGVLVATALPWNDDDTPDLDAYAAKRRNLQFSGAVRFPEIFCFEYRLQRRSRAYNSYSRIRMILFVFATSA